MQIDRPIAIALILFAILLLVFFLVLPEYNTFKTLRVELGEKTAEFNAKFEYYASVARVYDDLQGRQEDIKKIDDALPQDSDLGKIVYFLQETAKGNGLIVKDLFLSKTTAGNARTTNVSGSLNTGNVVRDIVFSMDLLGSYTSLENYIISLEKSARIFEVTNISFGVATGSTAGSSVGSFNLQIKTHSY